MENTVKIIWNGCDAHMELALNSHRDGVKFDEDKNEFYTVDNNEICYAFDAVEVDENDIPVDEDGEPDYDGLILCESGKIYKEI